MRTGKILLLIIVIVSVAVVSYLKYRKHSLKIVTLEPSLQEFKKKPADPGGIVIPNSNSLIYEQLKGGGGEPLLHNVLPEPEAPLNIIYNQNTEDKLYNSIDDILSSIGYFEEDKSQAEGDKDAMPASIAPELSAVPDQLKEDNKPEEDSSAQNTGLNFVKMPEGHKLDYLRIKGGVDEGGYKIQLGAAFSENEAKKEWDVIKQKHSAILKDAGLVLRKVEGKNERIFYLIMAGTYTSLSSAKLVCNKLSMRHQNCIITK
jgi:hypothetical protein